MSSFLTFFQPIKSYDMFIFKSQNITQLHEWIVFLLNYLMAWLNVINDVLNWSAWLLRSPQYWDHQLCCCLSSLVTSPHPQHLPHLGYSFMLRYSHDFFQTRTPWLPNPCACLVPQPAKFQTVHRCPNGKRSSTQILQRELISEISFNLCCDCGKRL